MSDSYPNVPRSTGPWRNQQISGVLDPADFARDFTERWAPLEKQLKAEWHTFTDEQKAKILQTIGALADAFDPPKLTREP